jgi:Spy/CpxP family protein refolding chaperone
MKRWTMVMTIALLAAAMPAARTAIAQHGADAPGHGMEMGGGSEDGLALDVDPADAGAMDGMASGHGRGFGRGAGLGALAKELNLSAAQKEKLAAVHDAHRRKAIAMRADLEVAQLDLHKLLRADTPDRRAIDAQIDRTTAMRGELHKARMGALLDARSVLTPQQREKLKELRASRPRMRGHGRHRPGGDLPPESDGT